MFNFGSGILWDEVECKVPDTAFRAQKLCKFVAIPLWSLLAEPVVFDLLGSEVADLRGPKVQLNIRQGRCDQFR
jgi:hypothetical protein